MQGLSMPHMGSPDMGGQAGHGLMPFASSQLEPPFAQLVPNGGGQLSHALPGSYQQAYIMASGRPEYLADELLLAHRGDESQELAGERQVCTFYLRTGTCAYGDRCKFQHPKDRPPPALNSRGYPIRNEVDCAHYLKKGWCAFGLTCKFNHPEPAPPTVQYSAQQGSYVPVVRPMAPLPNQVLAVPQQYYYAYPSSAPSGLYPVAPASVMPQLGGVSGLPGLGPSPGLLFPQRAAPGSMSAAAPGGGLALRQPPLQQGLQQLQGSPGSMDELALGFGSLRLQGSQQGLQRR